MSTGEFNKMTEDSKVENKKELNNKVKKITCKLKMINLEIAEKQHGLNENKKDTQGDILNKLKWTRSKTAQHNQELVSEEKNKEQLR